MTKRDIVSLAIIITGIYVGLFAMVSLLALGPTLLHVSWTNIVAVVSMLLTVVSLVCVIVVLFVVVRYSGKVALWLLPEDAQEEVALPCERVDVAAVAFAVLGLALCAWAVPRLAAAGASFALTRSTEFPRVSVLNIHGLFPSVVDEIVQCVLGAVLFVKAHALAAVWRRWQEADGAEGSPPVTTDHIENREHES